MERFIIAFSFSDFTKKKKYRCYYEYIALASTTNGVRMLLKKLITLPTKQFD